MVRRVNGVVNWAAFDALRPSRIPLLILRSVSAFDEIWLICVLSNVVNVVTDASCDSDLVIKASVFQNEVELERVLENGIHVTD